MQITCHGHSSTRRKTGAVVIVRIGLLLVALSFTALCPIDSFSQAPLYLVDKNTTVRRISFKFVEGSTIESDLLKNQIATSEPSFFDKVKRIVPFVSPRTHPFDPVRLQQDVVRLRRYYSSHGFLYADIDYPASQFDSTSNKIHVIFSIEEGPPLILQDFGFYDGDGNYALTVFPRAFRERWVAFRDRISLQLGQRYTDAERIRIQDRVINFMTDNGFAFARVNANAVVDSTANTADVRFVIEPGPRGRFTEILLEGNESVTDQVLIRELPFRKGDLYSHRRLTQGQQEIFGLNLFRIALADLPDQPADSTVTVRYRVRESKLRFITGQTGYSREDGVELNAEWRHRNFFGSARNFSISGRAATGLLATTSGENLAPRRFNVTLSVRQPYLFSSYLSGNVSPFIQFERDKNLRESTEPLGINRRDFGFSSTLVYQRLPFRPFTIAYTFVRSLQFTRSAADTELESRDLFNKSVISLNGTMGWLNNYLSPRRGYLIRPYIESAGSFLGSEVEYVKLGTEVQGFIPVTKQISVGLRTQVGRLWPLGKSRDALDADDPTFEDRFDPILFYAGGASDVRGWDTGFLGAKTAREASTGSETIVYEPAGGRAKVAMNVELRYPFPGLPSSWRLATFLDAGQVSARQVRMPDGSFQIVDKGDFRLDDLRFGVGSGVRYRTPVGFIRLDIAFKINPSDTDLLSPADAFAGNDNQKFSRRFNFHLSIGQTF